MGDRSHVGRPDRRSRGRVARGPRGPRCEPTAVRARRWRRGRAREGAPGPGDGGAPRPPCRFTRVPRPDLRRAAGDLRGLSRHQHQDQEEAMKSDAALKIDVERELAWDTQIDDTAFGVAAHHGVVTLTGTVPCWADKHAIEE